MFEEKIECECCGQENLQVVVQNGSNKSIFPPSCIQQPPESKANQIIKEKLDEGGELVFSHWWDYGLQSGNKLCWWCWSDEQDSQLLGYEDEGMPDMDLNLPKPFIVSEIEEEKINTQITQTIEDCDSVEAWSLNPSGLLEILFVDGSIKKYGWTGDYILRIM
tara:strand:+ start:1950 stop:2438 length:489 start_codon:yes stop_codon:yes gene_type:complete